jgi:UDP-N-acetylglucosamine--dolichyl-phosphate N-acetylglucosaminephosphotransferase
MFAIAFVATLAITPIIIRSAKEAGIVGTDIHKKDRPLVSELGGVALSAGIIAALLFGIAAASFTTLQTVFEVRIDNSYLLAVLSVVLFIEIIGFLDDVLGLRQRNKFLLPFGAALPLSAVKIAALHPFSLPIIGVVTFITPIVYEMVLIPLGIAASTNLTNVFAGYNGLEAGLGAVIAFFFLALGYAQGNQATMILSATLMGACLAFLRYNWYPAKIFPDDVGTLLIGAMIGSIAIVGGVELAGAILMLPYIIDFLFFKLPNNLPSKGWWSTITDKGLTHAGKPVHFGQFLVQKFPGISEQRLVLLILGGEFLIGVCVLLLYGVIRI